MTYSGDPTVMQGGRRGLDIGGMVANIGSVASMAPRQTMRAVRAAAPYARRFGPAGLAAGVAGAQAYNTLTNQDENLDIGGQLAGNAAGAGLATAIGFLPIPGARIASKILTPILAGVGGQAMSGVNLIPDSRERQAEFAPLEANREFESMARTNRLADNLEDLNSIREAHKVAQGRLSGVEVAQEGLNQILNGGGSGGGGGQLGGYGGISGTGSELMDGSFRPMTDQEMMFQANDPNGMVFRGMEARAQNEFGRHTQLQRLQHGQGMEFAGMNRQSEMAQSLLQAALADRASNLGYLSSMRSNVNYQ